MKNSDWDLDFRFGQAGEVLVNSLLTAPIETVEVKTDRRWKETGNLYIEVYCWSKRAGIHLAYQLQKQHIGLLFLRKQF